MNLFWTILKKTLVGFWEESMSLIVYNLLTMIALIPGPYLLIQGWTGFPLLLPLGFAWLLLAPPALFGLFHFTRPISQEKAVKFSTYFKEARATVKPAFIWGGISGLIAMILIANMVYYQQLKTGWAINVSMFFVSITLIWTILQVFVLAMYPNLVKPSYRVAHQNVLAMLSLQPVTMIAAMVLVGIVIFVGLWIPLLMGLVGISFIALFAATAVTEIIKK